MAYNTTASLDKLTYTNYVDFDKRQDIFGQFFWSENDSNYLDVKFKIFKKDDKKEFRLSQKTNNGRNIFQPVYEIEESAGQCGQKLCSGG